jgi:hypothetical protein
MFSALKKHTQAQTLAEKKIFKKEREREKEEKKRQKALIFNSGQVDTEDAKYENSSTMIHTE